MSFGFAISDFVAVLNTVERLAGEVRNYRDAPMHFQELASELHLFKRALTRLLEVQPDGEGEREQLEHLRAMAMHCQRPLLIFIEKMRLKESSIGLSHQRRITTLSTISSRLHWSLITRKDVEELRKVIMAGMTMINMILGMQQLLLLKRLIHQNETFEHQQLHNVHSTSRQLLVHTAEILNVPQNIARLQQQISNSIARQDETALRHAQQLKDLSVTSNDILQQKDSAVKAAGKTQQKLSRFILAILSIAEDVRRIFRILGTLSQDLFAKIAAQGRMLIGIHTTLKRLLQAMEAFSPHLSLDIVRLDDALGETWALPYQACQTMQSFKDILRLVVFGNNRPGSAHVMRDKFLLHSAQDRLLLTEINWQPFIESGAHILQAIIIEQAYDDSQTCPFPLCHGRMNVETLKCTICDRQSTFERIEVDELGLYQNIKFFGRRFDRASCLPQPIHTLEVRTCDDEPGITGPFPMEERSIEREIIHFRNVHYADKCSLVASIENARSILSKDPDNTSALRFLAAWRMFRTTRPFRWSTPRWLSNTARILERACNSDKANMEGWYLLGRLRMLRSDPKDALEAFDNAVQCNPRCAPLWNSIGICHFQLHQLAEAEDALSTARALDPENILIWHNITLLYKALSPLHSDDGDKHRRVLELPRNDPQGAHQLLRLEGRSRQPYAETLLKTSICEFDIRGRSITSLTKTTRWLTADHVQCICGFEHVQGANVYCTGCKTRQHISCYDYTPVAVDCIAEDDLITRMHLCMDCDPRRLDLQAAKIRQRRVATEILQRQRTFKAQSWELDETEFLASFEEFEEWNSFYTLEQLSRSIV